MLSFIINILSTPAILVGLMSLIGLSLQGKPIEEIVKGTVKTIVGFLVLSAGSSFLQTGSLNAFGDLFNYAFSMQGVVPNNEAVVSLWSSGIRCRHCIYHVFRNGVQYHIGSFL